MKRCQFYTVAVWESDRINQPFTSELIIMTGVLAIVGYTGSVIEQN